MKLLLLSILLAAPVAAAELPEERTGRYTRFEARFTPSLHGVAADAIAVSQHLYPDMTDAELWFVEREIAFLNGSGAETLTVPVYQRRGGEYCGDIRNWHVAVLKGRKYGVSPGLLLAIRSHENPSPQRDRYAYGVVAYKNTDLWTQAEWGAKIVARIAKRQGWIPMQPTRSNLYQLALVYVGQGKASARHWSRCVWAMMQRAQG